MAAILKKESASKSAAALSLEGLVSRAGGSFTLGGSVLALVVLATGYALTPTEPAPAKKPSSVQARADKVKKAKEGSQPEASHVMHVQASRIMAALVAHKEDKGRLPASLSELQPEYLASGFEDGKGALAGWKLDGLALKRAGVSKEVCAALSIRKEPTPIDHGVPGMQCVTSEGTNTLVYRLDEDVGPRKGYWSIELQGQLRGKLTTWKAIGAPTLVSECAHKSDQLSQTLVLENDNASFSTSICLEAYEQEVEAFKKGLSLLEGSDQLIVPLRANEQGWTLGVVARACEFGARTVSEIFLRKGAYAPPADTLSCDLKPTTM